MKHTDRVKIAIRRYRANLKKNGTTPFGISLAVGSGLDFLTYYLSAHKKI